MNYILEDGQPVAEPDTLAWELWFSTHTEDRVIARTEIGNILVSTVFLGIDHNFVSDGPPLLFETMIFGGAHDEWQERYTTRAAAESGHARAVEMVRPNSSFSTD